MYKKLMTIGLVMCMLLIGATMYSYPITCTKTRIMGTEVILLGDRHSVYIEELENSFKVQIEEDNNVLREWIENLSCRSEQTLFLLEWREDDLLSSDPLARSIFSERRDTLWYLKELTKSKSSTNNVEFKYADRRSDALTPFVSFDAIATEIICELLKGTPLAKIEDELWEKMSRNNSCDFLDPGISKWRELEKSLSELEDGKHLIHSTVEILRNLSERVPGPPSSAGKSLDNLAKLVRKLEGFRKCCDEKSQYFSDVYLEHINAGRKDLEAFLEKYLPDRTQSFITAVLNSMENTLSFQPYIELIDKDCNIKDALYYDIADAGFYMDILNAIRSGVPRVVLYAGSMHTVALAGKLPLIYEESTVIKEVGPRLEDITRGKGMESIIPSCELRMALDM